MVKTLLPPLVRFVLAGLVVTAPVGAVLAQPAEHSPVAGGAAGEQPPEPATRAGAIEAAQADKAKVLVPYEPNAVEHFLMHAEEKFLAGGIGVHPFFHNAYQGGGFTLGAGYLSHLGSYDTLDVRGSITLIGYKRIEAEYRAPRLFKRRGVVSVVGGWREATRVGFFGIGTDNTSADDEVSYGFTQPYLSANLAVRPTRGAFLLGTGVEYSTWNTQSGSGSLPSIEDVYTPETLTGLGASPTYVQVNGTIGFDSRQALDYSRRGGFYGITARQFNDTDGPYDFTQVDYEAIQHIPILRDAWVLSLRGRVETTFTDDGVDVPYFMLPSIGGGSTLRGFSSWRFRDRNSLLVSAEWRVLVNRFLDTAIFFDAGKVTRSTSDLDLNDLKTDYGIGFRLHGPAATPLRIDLAKSNEGFRIVFAASSAF